MIRQLSVSRKVLLGYGALFALLLMAVITANLLAERIAATAPLDGEQTRRQLEVLRLIEWSALALGATLCLLWGVHVGRSVAGVIERCRNVADQVSETAARCAEGTEAVLEAQKAAASVKTEIDRIVQRTLDLGSKSRGARRAEELIRGISDQATVLSCNAALEATAAGEAGKSFSTLAEQFARLSEETRSAAEDVRRIVRELEDSANTTVLATEEGLKAAELGLDAQKEASEKVHSIADGVRVARRTARQLGAPARRPALRRRDVGEQIADVAVTVRELEESSERVVSMTAELLERSRSLDKL